ncbi:MAG: HlyD family secretion protein [Deltaproteobacteria bacterium]|nr:HlyD family secretion protein [Deltaproteobacteria bacterium]MBW2141088.1 HlyD family secretion protein [Deltaproteobacteria bacterium]
MTEVESVNRRNGWKIVLAICILLILSAAAVGYWHFYMRGVISTDDARFDGELLDLAPQISGNLTEVRVNEGDQVRKGQILFVLDKRSAAAALAKAQAAVSSAQAALTVAQSQHKKCVNGPRRGEIQIAETVKRKADVAVRFAESEWSRVKALHNDRVMTEASRDKVRAEWEAAKQAQEEARLCLRLLREGSRTEDLAAAKANVDLKKAQLASAEAALHLAKINLDYTTVRVPFDGIVVRRWQNPGAIISAGRPILTILNPNSLHVAANIEEKDLYRISIGDKVDISVDAYPHLILAGHVGKILRATNSQFSLIPAEGVSGTFIKVAQRVPIRIEVDSYPDLPLGPGFSVEIRIYASQDNMTSGAVAADNE